MPARLVGQVLLLPQGALALSTGYLLALLLAARSAARGPSEPQTGRHPTALRFVVLVPAHDEQLGIKATLESLALATYPSHASRTIVIADNCTDQTANRARETGVEVWERTDPSRRGKGFALAWALGLLQAELDSFDAVVVVDADCLASPNMLSAIDQRLRSGASAVQVNYVAANPEDSHASALRFGGFALTNTVRFLGKQRLGLSCGLVGTGMAFTKDLLDREPWTATGLVEDAEYHMRLVESGERSEFVPEAWVSSAVPARLKGSADQQARWEQGKLQIIRHWSLRLVSAGLARRDIVCVHAGLEWLVPPQSLISAGSLGSALAGLLLGYRRLTQLSLATLAAQVTYVLAGLWLVRAPAHVYRALLAAPVLIAGKVALYVRLLTGRGPTSWVRTERETPIAAGRPA
ncbi:MAG: glycosyltransferase family 2 protein [Solirubrobacteraceae bacterium]